MKAPANLTLTDLTEPGQVPPTSTGHVRQRQRTGTKRSLTTVEFTMAERDALDRIAEAAGLSRAAVLRSALREFAEKKGHPVAEEARTAA